MTKPTTNTYTESETEQWLDSLTLENTVMRDAKYLRAIGKALTDLEEAEDALTEAVEAAKAAGDSWGMIGMVLGTSRQAAHRKFGPRPE